MQVDSANKHGVLLEMVQVLTDLDLLISKSYISSDGGWLMDGEASTILTYSFPYILVYLAIHQPKFGVFYIHSKLFSLHGFQSSTSQINKATNSLIKTLSIKSKRFPFFLLLPFTIFTISLHRVIN